MEAKYPNRITICMSDDFYKQIKQHLNMRYMMGDLTDFETDLLLLHICNAIDNDETTNPIFLRSIKERKEL